MTAAIIAAACIQSYSMDSWNRTAIGTNESIYALESYGGKLYAGQGGRQRKP